MRTWQSVFWQDQFKDLKAQPFPPLPSPSYQPQANKRLTWWIDGFQWCGGEFTASTIIRATWAILLAIYTDLSEAIFGATLNGRQAALTKGESTVGPKPVATPEQMSGPVTATVPVRVIIDHNKNVEQLLLQVQGQADEMAIVGRMGLPRIRRVSAEAERASHFQTMIVEGPVQENSEVRRASAHDTVWLSSSNAYAIIIRYRLEEQGLRLAISFDSGVVESEQVRKMAQQLEHVLRQVCAPENAARRLAEIETVSKQDLHDIWNWNATVPEVVEACVHDLIAETVRKQPDAPAVCAWDGELTYGELDEQSTRLAHHLVGQGVGPGVIVPLCFEKSMWTPVAMLGVMKAGGASVAMDATQPQDRLRSIVQQVEPRLILSSMEKQDLAHRLADYSTVVAVEKYLEASAYSHDRITLPRVDPSCPLYVVFTSGSTGTPKGVIISHRNLSSAVFYQRATSCIEKTSRVYDFASYAFDMAWVNFLKTVVYGGCLCIPSEVDRRENIAASMNAMKVNFTHLTPGVARVIKSSVIPSLITLSQGGEPLAEEDISNWGLHITLHTGYGPAECTPSSTLLKINPQTHIRNIGRGQGLVTWVVRSDGQQLAPVGAVGELWLEGPLVGQGYLNDLEKTAAAFVEDPSWLLRGSPTHDGRRGRLYRTGDLVQYDMDGSLIFIRRRDSQVKIRGQRVELGEVENHVRRGLAEGGISASVVAELITPAERADSVLAAFVSVREDSNKPTNEVDATLAKAIGGLEKRLAELVPAYMIPAAYIPLKTLPRTATNKTDRRQLRERGGAMTLEQLAALNPSSSERCPPETAMEQKLQELWAGVLGIEASSISATDSFLRIGGDSIQAMRLVGAAREQGLSLTVADVFKHLRLCELAVQVKLDGDPADIVIEPFSLLRPGLDVDGARARAAALCGLDRERIEDIFPCTPLQEGLIVMTAKRAGDYVARMTFELDENIDIERLRMAWQEVVATVPILRTRIIDLAEQGSVQVVVNEPLRWVTGHDDLRRYTEHDKEQRMGLGGPLSWIGMIKSGLSGKCHMVWTVHHALYDGWSLPLMLEEVEHVYWGMSRRRQAPFQAFVRHILGMNEDQAFSYWRAQLAGCKAAIFPELPRISYQPQADGVVEHKITDLRWPRGDITASTIVRAAWSLLVARHTDSNDVVLGATVTGRQAAVPGVERMIGPTIVTVPVRVVLDWAASVKDLLQQIQSQVLEMTKFEQTGLQRIRRISADVERSSQFQTLLMIQPREQEDHVSDYKRCLRSVETDTDVTGGLDIFNTYAIMVVCQLEASGLDMQVSFDSNVLPATQVQRITGHFGHVIRQLCAEAVQSTKVGEIEVISERDLQDIWTWNVTVPAAVEACVHDLITERVQEQPAAQAVCAWDGELTYEELDELSTRLAQRLAGMGVGPEVMMPLCFEKSMWTVVAMLGVMKAGGAFVLLDASQPEARLQTIVEQVGARLMLSSAQNEAMSSRLATEIMVVSSTVRERPQGAVAARSLPPGSPDAALYVVFTSGSTGRPKGVVITHASYASGAKNRAPLLGFDRTTRMLDFASYSFDMSIDDIMATLCSGGCVCILSDSDRSNDLAAPIKRMSVNTGFLTPTVARLLTPRAVPNLTSLQLAGEPISNTDVEMWAGQLELVISCGFSECSVTSTVTSIVLSNADARNIGRGVGSVTWVVNPTNHERLVPIGAVGELLIEGPTVGRGYLHDAEKTAAAFIEDPPWLLAGGGPGRPGRRGRLYKTGDLVRYHPDGTLIFIGRKDTQVKIRGQRVELGEVEYHVQQRLPEASEVVAEVIVPTGSAGDPTLAAFVKIDPGKDEELAAPGEVRETCDERQRQAAQKCLVTHTAGLSEALAEVVPRYMVPAAYIAVTAIPLTVSGKTDRKRLREIGAAMTVEELAALRAAEATKRAPTTITERVLRRLWSTTLGMVEESIGADDSFFQLGGDSIRAMKLVAAARLEGLLVTVADIFHRPKLCHMALFMGQATSSDGSEVPPFTLLGGEATTEEVRADVAQQCGVEVEYVEDVYPCTALQEGLMALSSKRRGAYVAQNVIKLPKTLELDRVRAAWDAVVFSSAILRTRIVQVEGRDLVQVVLDQSVSWTTADSLEAYLADDSRRPMELAMPLTRLAIVDDLATSQRYVVWTAHHATYDGWSMGLILGRVAKICRGEQVGQAPPYKGFLKYLGDIDRAAADAFWRTELEGVGEIAFPPLPSHGYQPQADSAVERLIEVTARMSSGITTATLIRAAWSVLMKRLSGSSDVVFGVTATGRSAPVAGIEKMEGPTFATLPVRVRVDEDMAADDFLQAVQAQAAALIAHEQVGLQNIRRLSDDAATACDFQTLLVIQPEGSERLDREGGDQKLSNNSGNDLSYFNTYTIMLVCHLVPRGVIIEAGFDARVVDLAQMQMILGQLECAMRGLVEESEVKLREIDCLDTDARAQIWSWNATVPEAVEACVHALVLERCLAQPEAQAVCAWDGELTYGELDERSTRLAQRLAGMGVGPEVMVPLCFEKSMWTVVAMLGVMKAGGACVPLDVMTPWKRLHTIIREVGANIIIVTPGLAERFFGEVAHIVTNIKSSTEQWAPHEISVTRVKPCDLAFVMFTSGSTGQPKGIALGHAAISTSIQAQVKAMNITQKSRYFQFASYSFDVSIGDIFATLLQGGTVCVPSEQERVSGLAQAIRSLRANQACLTPTVAAHINPNLVPTLANLTLGGEAMTESSIRTWAGFVQLRNVYGPVECSIWCMITGIVLSGKMPSNIGRAIGCVSWVVAADDHNRLATVGAVGELLIEGPIVGRGYLNDPEKTAAAFIEDPPWLLAGGGRPEQPGRRGRLYKTGDLVRYQSDGTLIFVGRKDTQVKIRGQRVELGEVEHHIQQRLPEESEVVAEVIVPASGAGDPILAAFVKIPGEVSEMSDKIRTQASQKYLATQTAGLNRMLGELLPRYMVPSVYIAMTALPLTLSGKIDRKRLRETGAAITVEELAALRAAEATPKRAPTTATECVLRRLWSTILEIAEESIGVDDSFFQLGGDSIRAMKLIAAARLQDLLVTVVDIFHRPRLCDLALLTKRTALKDEDEVVPFSLLGRDAAIKEIQADVAQQCGVKIEQVEDIYPCTALQEGLMALSSKRSGAYIAQNVIKLPKTLKLDRVRTAWDAVVLSSAILRTRIVQLEGYGLMQVVLDQSISYSWTTANSLKEYLVEDGRRPMELATPLVRLAIVDDLVISQQHVVWTAHHAIYDGWSMGLILGRVARICQGERVGQAPPYKSFIKYLGDIDRAAAYAFWRTELEGVEKPAFPLLPSYGYQPQADSVVERYVEVITRTGSGITTASLIWTAWSVVMKRLSGSSDIIFGVTATGRSAPIARIEEIEGPTFATLPVRVQVDEDMTANGFLRAVQAQAAALMAYEQVGLQNIRRLSDDAATACDFQSLLVIQPDEEEGHQRLSDDSGNVLSYFNTYAITLICHLNPRGVKIEACFDMRIVNKPRMRMILGQLECAIRGLAGNGEIKLKDIDCLDADTKAQIWRWNKTVPATVNVRVYDLIGEQCQAQPEAQAVNAWDGEITYAELDEWSTQLAQRLVEVGVGPEVIVPLCFEKSMWTIVAILGVMKAGGAFVLLDASQPEARLQIIVDQVKARLVLSSAQNKLISSKLATDVILVSYTALKKLREAVPARNTPPILPETALYVVFTSGSTGTPKGVVITHASFASAAHYRALLVGFDHTTRMLDFASYSFDAGIGNVLDALINGSCLCIPSDEERLNNLVGYMRKMQVTSANLTPTVAQQLVPSAVPNLASLQLVGEPMAKKDLEMWASHLDLINSYGPAECSVTCTFHPSMSTTTDARNIGRGVGSVTWVVDLANHERLVPIGTVGELLIEGPIVGRGYLNDPEKTAAAFIEDPPWLLAGGGRPEQPGRRGRLYKTGDLVRYQSDGTLIFVGRKDTQVKIRGQRVELGEVEYSVQQRLPKGTEIVAELIVPADGVGDPTLVAFVKIDTGMDEVPAAPGEVRGTTDERRRQAAQKYLVKQTVGLSKTLGEVLPRYMVPSAYIAVTAIPLTASGKTDRKRLREIGAAMTVEELAALREVAAAKRAPTTATEYVLRRLWSTTLGVAEESIGADDSFFQLGGDSIGAMKLVAAARLQGLLVTVADIFHRPKLCNMATCHLSDTTAQKKLLFRPFSSLNVPNAEQFLVDVVHPQIKLQQYRIEDVFPTTDFQDYAIKSTHEKPRSSLLYVLTTLSASTNVHRLMGACRALIRRRDALRTVYVSHNDSFLQVVLEDIKVDISVSRTNYDSIIYAKRICAEDAEGELPLGCPCPRFWIIQQGDHGIRLILRISHAQYDGISPPVILQDLQALYAQEPMISAPSFSTYMNSKIQAADARCQEYWRDLLDGSVMTPLPSQNHNQTASLLEGDHSLSVSLKATVPMPKPPPGVTLATLISVAWALVISGVTSHHDIVFGQLISGRNISVPSIDNIVGTCINIVPVRLQLRPGWKFLELLSALQDQKVASTQFEFYGLTEIVENCVRWPRSTNFSWVAQHQNVDEIHSLSFADVDSKVEYFAPHVKKAIGEEIFLYTAPLQNELQIELTGEKCRKCLLEEILEGLSAILARGAH